MGLLNSAMSNDTVDNTQKIISLQLYTVRDALSQNIHDALKNVAGSGYRYVEVADTYNYSLSEFVSVLKRYNLEAISAHIDYLVLLQDTKKVLEEAVKASLKYLVVPWIGPEVWENDSLVSEVITALSSFSETCENEGIQFCYHNHAHEINNSKGTNFLDLILEKTARVYLELDLGWVYVATDEDPLDLVKRYKDRIKLFHLKDVAQREPVCFTEFGRGGKINWEQILPEIWQINKSPWIIEQDDNFSESSILSAREGLINLQKILGKI